MNTTPLAVAEQVTVRQDRTAAGNRDRYLAARRRDAARNGYRGPLTRAELAAHADRVSRTA